jgi:hypothetical protein
MTRRAMLFPGLQTYSRSGTCSINVPRHTLFRLLRLALGAFFWASLFEVSFSTPTVFSSGGTTLSSTGITAFNNPVV